MEETKNFGLISVIMAAYNAERTVRRAIGSVLSQTYPDLELLVIDDGSCDGTAAAAEDMAATDARIRVLRNEENHGVAYTRKRGLDAARGEWIAILDSDDTWAPEKLEKQIALQRATGAELLFTGSAFMDAAGNPIPWYLHAPATVTYRQLLKQNVLSNSSALLRRELYAAHFVTRDDIHEDFAIWLNILKSGRKAYGVDEPLLTFRISGSSKSGNKFLSARMNWKTYRYVGLNFLSALYYEGWYALKGALKYRHLRRAAKKRAERMAATQGEGATEHQ